MMWKEFKETVEDAGVTDDMVIHAIHLEKEVLRIYPPHIMIFPNYDVHPNYQNKEVDIW